MRDIGKNIRDLRISKNMTQDQLAEKLFVTRQTVSNYETGKSRPDIDMLETISIALDCDINTILYGNETTCRKSEYIKTAAAVVVCIALFIINHLVLLKLSEIKRNMYIGSLYAFWTFTFVPAANTVLGWTVMQSFGTVFRIKITRPAWTVYILRVLLCLISVYVIYIFVNFAPAATEDLIYITKRPGTAFLNNYSYLIPSVILFLMMHSEAVFSVFLAVGAVLWLCGFLSKDTHKKS
ncbi:MAG: helix-turn-helix transcriptional regulator [Oscillospiraceae bacterium]|nr:helix-turn-helix transcriptional regulator [Oscillospiraceae bacterium]